MMNPLSHSPVLPSPDVYDYEGLAWDTIDQLQAKPLTLEITPSPPSNAPVVHPCRANANLVQSMSNGACPEVANCAGRVTRIDQILNLANPEDEDRDPGEKSSDEVSDDDNSDVDPPDDAVDAKDAIADGSVPGHDQAYVLSASDEAVPPRHWRSEMSRPRCGDLDQAAQRHVPQIQEAMSTNHRVKLPTLEVDRLDDTLIKETNRSPLPTQHVQSERPVWKPLASPAPSHVSTVSLAARALATASKPQNLMPNGNFLGAPRLDFPENNQAAETDRAKPVELYVRLSPPSGVASRLLDPGSVMARRASSSSSTHTSSRRDEPLPTNFGAVSHATSPSSMSPVDRLLPLSPQGFPQQRSPGPIPPTSPIQRQFQGQYLPPMQPSNTASRLDTEASSTTLASGKAIVGAEKGQQQQSLPSIRDIGLDKSYGTPPHNSNPLSPSDHTFSSFSTLAGSGEETYPPISRRATTDCSGGMSDPEPPARDTPQPLRRVATAPKYPSIAPQTDNDKGGGARRSQPAIAAATSRSTAQSQQAQNPPAPAGGFVCPEPNCKALPFLTQYQLSSHANVHSSERPHFCSVPECPHSKPGNGFKRKNEMIRHGLVHRSPGYTCPFCPGRKHKYPRRDNLRRHVRGAHKDKSKDDPQLLLVLSQRPEGTNSRRRQAT